MTIENRMRPVAWRSLAGIPTEEDVAWLTARGLELSDNAGLVLVTTDDYLSPVLEEVAASETRPWLLARFERHETWIGPVFGLPESTCWQCLAHWMRPRREATQSSPGSPCSHGHVLEEIASAAMDLASGRLLERPAAVVTIDAATKARTELIIPARLRCRCGGPRAGTASTLAVTNSITGLAFSLTRYEPEADQLHHASCMHVYPRVQQGTRRAAQPASAFGRGLSAPDAINACLAEAVERYSAVWQGTEPMAVAAFEDDGRFLRPESILLFSERQYADRDDWNRTTAERFRVPEPFIAAAAAHWSPVRSLLSGQTRLAPTALCYGGFMPDAESFGIADSIGCAAGATLQSAILSALLEKIERDAVAIWWYSRARRPRLDTGHIANERLHRALREARAHQLRLEILDITNDVEVPVYVCIGSTSDGLRPCFGAAAHPDATAAACRAAEEMLQMHFWSGQSQLEPSVRAWLESGTLANSEHLAGAGTVQLRDSVSGTTEFLLERTVTRLGETGLDAFFLDLTRPEVGLPVARVLIPESRHCWNRLAPGRLYDVPLQLGWIETRLTEADVNPMPCPL